LPAQRRAVFAERRDHHPSRSEALSDQFFGSSLAVVASAMSNPFRYFNSSPEIIRLAVLMYVKYPLSLRNVEDLLAERGIDISHETVRFWWNRFGPMFAAEIRKRSYAGGLVGLGRRKGQRNKCLGGLSLRLRRPNICPAPSVTAHRVIAAGIAGPPKRLE